MTRHGHLKRLIASTGMKAPSMWRSNNNETTGVLRNYPHVANMARTHLITLHREILLICLALPVTVCMKVSSFFLRIARVLDQLPVSNSTIAVAPLTIRSILASDQLTLVWPVHHQDETHLSNLEDKKYCLWHRKDKIRCHSYQDTPQSRL